MRFGLAAAGAAESSSTAAARASLTLLEGGTLLVELDESGVRAITGSDGEGEHAQTYDSVHSLLLNTSPAFTAAFNSSLFAKLREVAEQREVEEEET